MKRVLALIAGCLVAVALGVLAVPSAVGLSTTLLRAATPAKPTPTIPAWQLPPGSVSGDASNPLTAAAPVPSADKLAAALAKTLKPDGGGRFSAYVTDAASGKVLFERGSTQGVIPASNMKLLTAIAALSTLGPQTRFHTQVLAGSTASSVVLRGGGDVLLSADDSDPSTTVGYAGLKTLAEATVKSLIAAGIKGVVKVSVDDSLFSGPTINPAVDKGDVVAGETAPVYSLAMNSARYKAGVETGPRPQDSALDTGQQFAAALTAAGTASGISADAVVVRGTGNASKVLASADSATVGQQVESMLQVSDNYLADVLGRMVAIKAGQAGSYTAALKAVEAGVKAAGISTAGMVIADLSGLSLRNRVSTQQFGQIVAAITSGPNASLRAALDGFPIAGLTGTLNNRYGESSSHAAAGLVRAKTGTLNTALALSGYVVDSDGRLLVFSFIGNGLTPGSKGNKAALDASAAVLAGCGCR
ncbi:D-alanyl-D-alanine carboxypeptidase/D-alanyl-D-alanine endopeptidase [Pseudarthrobacter sp. J1763]|uniref:D-alanyl-D-alanine carboxypeptidase/D-alanyl-D-alanine endopeptidase n=1 Tax=Pseudarthrobacter sp. J1763 TaxID=3420445 RepID=UPI003D2E87E5